MRLVLTCVFLATCLPTAFGQATAQTDIKLEQKLKTAFVGFRGDVGVYVQNLRTGKTVTINADTLFPTASTIKDPDSVRAVR